MATRFGLERLGFQREEPGKLEYSTIQHQSPSIFLELRRGGKVKTRGEDGDALDLCLPGILEPGPHDFYLLPLPLFLRLTRRHGRDVLVKSVHEAAVFRGGHDATWAV